MDTVVPWIMMCSLLNAIAILLAVTFRLWVFGSSLSEHLGIICRWVEYCTPWDGANSGDATTHQVHRANGCSQQLDKSPAAAFENAQPSFATKRHYIQFQLLEANLMHLLNLLSWFSLSIVKSGLVNVETSHSVSKVFMHVVEVLYGSTPWLC